MKTIYVDKAFKLNRPGKDVLTFPVGFHTVEPDVASHWFVKANSSEGPETPGPDVGLAQENSRLKAVVSELEDSAKTNADENARLQARVTELEDELAGRDGQEDGQSDGQSDDRQEPDVTDEEVSSWSAQRVLDDLAENPGHADQLEKLEKKRDNPRTTVLNAIKKARG